MARLVSGGNCVHSGVLPPEEGVKIAEELGASFSAPDLEMDLTEVPEDKLLEAMNTHALDVSYVLFGFLLFFRVIYYDRFSVLSCVFHRFLDYSAFLGYAKIATRLAY